MSRLMCLEVRDSYLGDKVSVTIKEVTIEKETPKQYTISGGFYRSKVNKSDLLQDLGYSSPQIFCLEEDVLRAIEKAKSRLQNEIASYKNKIQKKEKAIEQLQLLEG